MLKKFFGKGCEKYFKPQARSAKSNFPQKLMLPFRKSLLLMKYVIFVKILIRIFMFDTIADEEFFFGWKCEILLREFSSCWKVEKVFGRCQKMQFYTGNITSVTIGPINLTVFISIFEIQKVDFLPFFVFRSDFGNFLKWPKIPMTQKSLENWPS